MITENQDWPDFDTSTDDVFQTVIQPFILRHLQELKDYDDARGMRHLADPKNVPPITYKFYPHAFNAADDVRKTCAEAGLPEQVQNNMYWAMLAHDIAKKDLDIQLWDMHEPPPAHISEKRRTHPALGVHLVKMELTDHLDHPFVKLMIDIIGNHHEHIDGSGEHGMTGDQMSPAVKLCAIIESIDGSRTYRPHMAGRDLSIPAVLDRYRTEKMAQFDHALFEFYAAVKMKEYNSALSSSPAPVEKFEP